MPIEQIRLILKGDLPVGDALDMQKIRLEAQAKKLQSAISFCEQMGKEQTTLEDLDIDRCLEKMEKDTAREGYFTRWVEDYKKIAREEAQRVFTFIPDDAVTNPREFTNALLAYAREKELNLVITKEGMDPKRRRKAKLLYHLLPALGFVFVTILMMAGTGGLSLSEFFTTKEGVILLVLILILGIAGFVRCYRLYRNMDGPK